MPAFAELGGAGPTGFGVLMSATGLGSIVGTAYAGAIRPSKAYGRVMLLGAFFAVLLLIGFAFATHGYRVALGARARDTPDALSQAVGAVRAFRCVSVRWVSQ